jgi:hypothetical protein
MTARREKLMVHMLKDRRKFYRWQTSISCVCRGNGCTFTGEIENLSLGGARIVNPSSLPPEGIDLDVVLHRRDYSVSLKAHVFYVEAEAAEMAFGIEFYGTLHERTQKLLPLFRQYLSEGQPGAVH